MPLMRDNDEVNFGPFVCGDLQDMTGNWESKRKRVVAVTLFRFGI